MNLEIVINILSGLAICIPLVAKLVQTIYNHAKEKNWIVIVELVLQLMKEAETMYSKGEERKEFVMRMLEASAKQMNFTYDEEARAKVSAMIDSICDASKVINAN